ncbi:MAG: hypothetical protein NTZ32_16165 [Planctomycetales bacterium]|nr:hypothetical protein [Planctomycetales bacterium]
MQRSFWGCLLLAGFAASAPQASQAQLFTRPFHNCCETCEMPQAQCSCQAHVQPQVQTRVQMQTRTRPVVQTQLRPQQVTTYRDVTETRVRNESVVENVPSTTYRNVTTDEGGYQMVWVPKPVTKQVAQTVVQQQVKTRAVPYQVTHRVPQVSTQMIPVQTVQHITEQVPVTTTMAVPAPMTFTPMAYQSAAASSCNVCDRGSTAMNMPMLSQQFGYAPQVSYAPSYVYGAPLTASIPTMPAITVPVPQTALAPTPITAERPAEQWQTVPARGASSSRSQEYDSPSSRPVPTPADDVNAIPRRTSMFSPAPSAAVVWNSRR